MEQYPCLYRGRVPRLSESSSVKATSELVLSERTTVPGGYEDKAMVTRSNRWTVISNFRNFSNGWASLVNAENRNRE